MRLSSFSSNLTMPSASPVVWRMPSSTVSQGPMMTAVPTLHALKMTSRSTSSNLPSVSMSSISRSIRFARWEAHAFWALNTSPERLNAYSVADSGVKGCCVTCMSWTNSSKILA